MKNSINQLACPLRNKQPPRLILMWAARLRLSCVTLLLSAQHLMDGGGNVSPLPGTAPPLPGWTLLTQQSPPPGSVSDALLSRAGFGPSCLHHPAHAVSPRTAHSASHDLAEICLLPVPGGHHSASVYPEPSQHLAQKIRYPKIH